MLNILIYINIYAYIPNSGFVGIWKMPQNSLIILELVWFLGETASRLKTAIFRYYLSYSWYDDLATVK